MNVLFFVSAISWWQICYPCLSKLQNIRPCDKSYAQTIISGQLLAVSYVGQCMVSVLSQKYFNRNPGEAVIMALQWTQSGTHFTESENWEDCPHLGPLPFCRYPCIFNSWNHHGLSKPSQCLNISVCFYVGMLILQFQSPQVATFCFFSAPFWLACLTRHSPRTTTPWTPRFRHRRFRRQGGSGLCRTSRYGMLALESLVGRREVLTTGWVEESCFFQSNGWLVCWERFLGWGFVWRSWDVGLNDWIISFWRREKIPMQLMPAKEVEQHNYRCAVRKAMCKITTNVFLPPFSWTHVRPLEIRPVASITSILGLCVCIKCFKEYFSRLVYFHVMISTFEHHQNSV